MHFDRPRQSEVPVKEGRRIRFALYFPFIALLWNAVPPLYSTAVHGVLPVTLDFREPLEMDVEGMSTTFQGFGTVAVSVDGLGGGAVTLFVLVNVLWIASVLGIMWFSWHAMGELIRGDQVSVRMSRNLAGLVWTLGAGGVLYWYGRMLADTTIIRDLGLEDADIGPGTSFAWMYLGLGILFFLEILRRAVKRGRMVQDELDGLV